jgi:hypothetical protein
MCKLLNIASESVPYGSLSSVISSICPIRIHICGHWYTPSNLWSTNSTDFTCNTEKQSTKTSFAALVSVFKHCPTSPSCFLFILNTSYMQNTSTHPSWGHQISHEKIVHRHQLVTATKDTGHTPITHTLMDALLTAFFLKGNRVLASGCFPCTYQQAGLFV